jgi:hypothetical protein
MKCRLTHLFRPKIKRLIFPFAEQWCRRLSPGLAPHLLLFQNLRQFGHFTLFTIGLALSQGGYCAVSGVASLEARPWNLGLT